MENIISKAILMMAFIFGGCESFADPKVYKLDLSYARIIHNTDPMLIDVPNKDWSDAVNIDAGVQAGRFYLDANPHFENAYHKVTAVGLLFHTGIELNKYFDFEWTHHSRHSADRVNSYEGADTRTAKYPLFDSIGIRLHFIPDARRTR
jgi:hypothetical protein